MAAKKNSRRPKKTVKKAVKKAVKKTAEEAPVVLVHSIPKKNKITSFRRGDFCRLWEKRFAFLFRLMCGSMMCTKRYFEKSLGIRAVIPETGNVFFVWILFVSCLFS